MKRLLKYMKQYRTEAIIGPLFKWLEALFELLVPLVVARLIDGAIPSGSESAVVRLCLVLCALGAVGLASSLTAQYFAAKAATGFAANVRGAMFSHMQSLSYTELDRIGSATMVARMTDDLAKLQNGVNMFLRLFLRSPFVVFGAMAMAMSVNFRVSLVFAAVIPVLFVVVTIIMKLTIPTYKRVQEKSDGLFRLTGENITGVRVIRALGMGEGEREKFAEENSTLAALQIAAGRVSSLMNPLTYIVINGAMIILIHSGAVRVNVGGLSQGEVIALVNYMSQILVELIKLANLIITVTRALACAGRISDFLGTPTEKSELAVAPADGDADASDDVVFDHVTFTYPDAASPSLEDVSFRIKHGGTLGIIGPTGSGKTTLVNLIPRYYDATSGSVCVLGHNVKSLDPAELRRKIGVVEQRAQILSGSVRYNLTLGREGEHVPDEELWHALHVAQAEEFVRSKDGGLDAELYRGGRNLSGGQRQRINIARAVAKSPDIIILDDSSSALDYATDAALRREIAGMCDVCTIIVSQRAAALSGADQILVLDDGHAVGLGTHDELLRDCPVYGEICRSQGIGGDAV